MGHKDVSRGSRELHRTRVFPCPWWFSFWLQEHFQVMDYLCPCMSRSNVKSTRIIVPGDDFFRNRNTNISPPSKEYYKMISNEMFVLFTHFKYFFFKKTKFSAITLFNESSVVSASGSLPLTANSHIHELSACLCFCLKQKAEPLGWWSYKATGAAFADNTNYVRWLKQNGNVKSSKGKAGTSKEQIKFNVSLCEVVWFISYTFH